MSVKSESRSIKRANHPDTQHEILATQDLHDEGSVDPVYQAKARVLNRALQEIGMGKYQVLYMSYAFPSISDIDITVSLQWGLFVVAGFGWFS